MSVVRSNLRKKSYGMVKMSSELDLLISVIDAVTIVTASMTDMSKYLDIRDMSTNLGFHCEKNPSYVNIYFKSTHSCIFFNSV